MIDYVKDYSMNSLMSNFSFVFQSVYLFADTIENNIKFGRQDASHEEVVEAYVNENMWNARDFYENRWRWSFWPDGKRINVKSFR